MKSPSKRQAVYSSWNLSSTSELQYYLTAFPVSGTVHIFCVYTAVAAMRDKRCLWSFPFSSSDTGRENKGGGEGTKSTDSWTAIRAPSPVTRVPFCLPRSTTLPHSGLPICLLLQFVVCYVFHEPGVWNARGWLLGVNSAVKYSHVLKYHGSKMWEGVKVWVHPFLTWDLD